MTEWLQLLAADGHAVDAYRAAPSGPRRGGLVLVQEIFGVNAHVQRVAEGFAADGYEVLAPALFDRLERGVQLGYGEADVRQGRGYRTALGWELPLLDLAAAVAPLGGRPGVVGYCWGGSLAFLAAAELDVACAVAYYGGQIMAHKERVLHAPVLMHFGEQDPLIPPADVAAIVAAQPRAVVHRYDAGHGFSCDARGDFSAEAASLARRRTLEFLAAHVGA
jgi:carboxymethylenebutenolidase